MKLVNIADLRKIECPTGNGWCRTPQIRRTPWALKRVAREAPRQRRAKPAAAQSGGQEGVETRRGAPKAARGVRHAARSDGEGIVQRTNARPCRDAWRRKTWCDENPPPNGLPVRVRSPAPDVVPVCSTGIRKPAIASGFAGFLLARLNPCGRTKGNGYAKGRKTRRREKPKTTAQNGGARISRALRRNKVLAHSTIADLPGQRIDQPRKSEQSRDAEGAGDEECGQHDSALNVTKCIVSLARACGLGIRVNDNKLLRYRKQLSRQESGNGLQRPSGAGKRRKAWGAHQMQSNITSTVWDVTPRTPSLWISTVCNCFFCFSQ